MRINRRSLLATAAAAPLAAALPARAQTPGLKIGVLTDMSGPYKDLAGPGAVQATQMAVAEFASKGIKAEIVFADHQNKADVSVSIARQWIDRDGVDLIIDVANSAVGLATAGVVKEKNKVLIATGAATSDLTGSACNMNTIHWVYDTYMLAKSTGGAMVKAGGDSWYFMTADYAFGHALERDVGNFVKAAGGKVVGASRTPFPGTTDFSSFLLQAQASGAKVLGLANAGTDAVNSIKQAAEFGLTRPGGMRIAAMLTQINDVHALGLQAGQNLLLTESFYWDMNDGTRAFAARFAREMRGQHPGMIHAGGYSAAMHYLKAAASLGVAAARADGAATIRRMKEMPTNDPLFGPGQVRADGRKIHPMHLFLVKSPGESRGPWDYFQLLRSLPAGESFRPMAEGGCALAR